MDTPLNAAPLGYTALHAAVLRGTLPNGLKYYIRQNAKPEKRLELRLAVKAGSVRSACVSLFTRAVRPQPTPTGRWQTKSASSSKFRWDERK